jgi:hypothetical protein
MKPIGSAWNGSSNVWSRWLWLKDVVDLSWEILRLRRLKIDLVEIDREDQNAIVEWGREHADEPSSDFFGGPRTPPTPAQIEARKNTHHFSTPRLLPPSFYSNISNNMNV